jgi:hypothetical protein
MGEIQYENHPTGLPKVPCSPEEPDLIRRLMRWGIVSTPQQAQLVLVGFVALALCLALYFSAKAFGGSANYSAGELGEPITNEIH